MSQSVILCVDDEKIILDSLYEQIHSRFGQHFEIETAEGGEEALEVIDDLTTSGRQLALVISDQLMPGMKGDDFLIRVHQELPETLKILLTGQASLESVGKAINHARIYRYLVKPWDSEDLLLTVEKALNSYLQYLQLQEYNRLLVSLNAAVQDISSEVSLQNVIDKVLESTLESTRAERGFLLMQQEGELVVQGVSSVRKEEERSIRERLQVEAQTLTRELIGKISDALNADGRQVALVSPINKKGRNLGYMYLENNFSRDYFTDNQKQILQMLASQAAISLDNANLYAKLEQKNEDLERINLIIREKNEDITSSIRYAKRIQEAILPNLDTLKPFLPKSSLMFKPKDIVSGDFYWWQEREEHYLIAVADCTGHGVPGGFMSVLANTMLNEAVNVYGLTEPGAVLQMLSLQMREMLKQDSANTARDGMDLSLVLIDPDQSKLVFSGARRPLWRVRKGVLEVFLGDKLSIGDLPSFGEISVPAYRQTELELEPGDTFYMFSDGLVDQFGGPQCRRFNRKRLTAAILDAQAYPVMKQSAYIASVLEAWQGSFEQTDDMLLIAFQV